MRSTWAQAVANSVSVSLPIRAWKACRIDGLGVVAHGDDEGKAVLCDIGGVQRWKVARSSSVSASSAALACSAVDSGVRRRRASLPARSGWARRTPSRSSGWPSGTSGPARCAGRPRCHARGQVPASQARSAIQGECSKMEPKRSTNRARVIWLGRSKRLGMGLCPMPGDVDAAREPDAVVRLCIVEKALQPGDLARAADQPAMQADREHLGRGRLALGVERVEAVLQVLEELLAGDVARRGGKAHVVGFERIGDHQLVMVAIFAPIGQVVVVGVGDPGEPAGFRRQPHGVHRCSGRCTSPAAARRRPLRAGGSFGDLARALPRPRACRGGRPISARGWRSPIRRPSSRPPVRGCGQAPR
jgi:hypothetical protein